MVFDTDQVDLESFQRLQAEARHVASRLSGAAAAASGAFSGSDDSGVVEVVVGGDGAPTRVRIDGDWQRRVGLTGLGAAVVAALTRAAQARTIAWAESVNRSDNAASSEPLASETASGGDGIGVPSAGQSLLALREAFDLVEKITATLPELRQRKDLTAQQAVVSANARKTVRVTAYAGVITSVEFDRGWLQSARPERIADAVREALTTSAGDAAMVKEQAYQAMPELERLRRITASPDSLLREIGLLR